MALPEIPGLYDNVTTVGEIKVGNTVAAIYTANGNSLEWIYQIPTLIFNQYSCPCLRTTWGQDHPAGSYNNGLDFITDDDWIGNKPIVLCTGNATFTDALVANIDQWRRRNNNSTTASDTVISSNLLGYQRMQSSRVILEADTREHYIALPQITAKALITNSPKITNIPIGTYISTYAETYPYIEKIDMVYYYKPILENSNVTQKYFSFAMPSLNRRSNYLYYSSAGSTTHYLYGATGTSMVTNFGTTICQVPAITTATVTVEGVQRYTSGLNSTNGTHGIGYHFFAGDIANSNPPTLYITLEQAINIINSVGFWWGETLDDIKYRALGENTTSNAIHCPVITSGGATTTKDWKGAEIKEHWNDKGYRANGGISLVYNQNINLNEPADRSEDATEDPDPLSDDNTTALDLDKPKFTGVGCFSTYYAMSMGQIRRFNDDMWTSDEDWLTSVITGLRFWGSNPMEAIMSLRLYPFDVTNYTTTVGHESIKLGRVVMPTATGEVLNSNSTALLDLGSVFIRPEFNDFRDYYPYTQITLYVPYVGFININPNEFMFHLLNIKMVVDLTTGTCECCVYADGRPMVYKSGTIGVEIPISLSTMTATSVAMMQSIIDISTSLGVTAVNDFIESGGVKGGNWSRQNNGRIARAHSVSDNSFDFDVSENELGDIAMNLYFGGSTVSQSGSSSPACGMANTPYPYLIFSYPITEIPPNYNHTYGKVCHSSGHLSSFIGFTVCRNVDTSSIICTSTEQHMIKKLLESGIYNN